MKSGKLLPTTLFGRMLLIILTPMILVQLITVLIFYERHWDTVTRYMANNLAADIRLLVDQFSARRENSGDAKAASAEVALIAGNYFFFSVEWQQAGLLGADSPSSFNTYAGQRFHLSLAERLDLPFRTDLDSHPDLISITIQYPDGVLAIEASRKRIFSSTSWLFILWTVGSSIILFAIALLFLRGQVRPIRRLAVAARQLGLGRPAPDFRLEGAREVRLAGRAFQAMHQRINRQMVERTQMLAGVSHDLRTPLTRLRLQVALLPETEDTTAMQEDIREMETMIDGYLHFASTAVEETPREADILSLIEASMSAAASVAGLDDKAAAAMLTLVRPDAPLPMLPVRQRAIRRALDNLIGNALRHGGNCRISLQLDEDQIQIIIDDDGPGIPREHREAVVRPFVRLQGAVGEGVGLGLSIANDVALAHGGLLLLGEAPEGGLRARLQLPR